MRLLFELDKKDWEDCTSTFVRNSARAIIISDNRLGMIHSQTYDYYKFPGGGIEGEELPTQALIRETREEAGLVIKPETITPYGYVHRRQKSHQDPSVCFIQDNFYYRCEVEDKRLDQQLDDYEASEGFCLEFVAPEMVLAKNRTVSDSPYDVTMFEREARVVELLLAEGVLS